MSDPGSGGRTRRPAVQNQRTQQQQQQPQQQPARETESNAVEQSALGVSEISSESWPSLEGAASDLGMGALWGQGASAAFLEAMPSWEDFQELGTSAGEAVGLIGTGVTAALPEDPDEAVDAILQMSLEDQQTALGELLAGTWYGGGPAQEQLYVAREVLKQMPEEGRTTFVNANPEGYAAITAAGDVVKPEQQQSWGDQAAGAWNGVQEAATSAWADPGQAWEDAKGGAAAAWDGTKELAAQGRDLAVGAAGWVGEHYDEVWSVAGDLVGGEAGVGLNDIQRMVISDEDLTKITAEDEGIYLDTSFDNRMDVTTDSADGRLEYRIPQLHVKSTNLTVENYQITTGPWSVKSLFIAVDAATAQGSDSMVEAGADEMRASGVKVVKGAWAADGSPVDGEPQNPGDMFFFLPDLLLSVLSLSTTRTGGAAEVSQDLMVAEITDNLRAMAESTFGALPSFVPTSDVDDGGATFSQRLSDAFTGMQTAHVGFAALTMDGGVVYNAVGEEGLSQTTVGRVHIADLDVTITQQNTIVALTAEQQKLTAMAAHTAAQTDRLAWIAAELPRLKAQADRKEVLARKEAAGEVLSVEERDEVVLIDRALRTGVAEIKVGLLESGGASSDGQGIRGAQVSNLDVTYVDSTLGTDALGAETSAEKQFKLNDSLGLVSEGEKNARAERAAKAADDGTYLGSGASLDVNADSGWITGLNAAGATADFARVDGMDLGISEDGLHFDADGIAASAVDYGGNGVRELTATGVNVDMNGDDLAAQVATAQGQGGRYADGDTEAGVGGFDVGGLDVLMDGEGTVAQVDRARLTDLDVLSRSSDLDLDLDELSVGQSGVVLDADNNLVGLAVDDLKLEDVHIELWKPIADDPEVMAQMAEAAAKAKEEAGEQEQEAEAAPELFYAGALAHASGTFRLVVPVYNYGVGEVTIFVQATDGQVNLQNLDIQATEHAIERGFWGRVREDIGFDVTNGGESFLRVVQGKGLMAKIGFINLSILMDTREYSGLRADSGRNDRGGILLQPFVEGMMSAQSEVGLSDEGKATFLARQRAESDLQGARGERREDRRTEREDRKSKRVDARETSRRERYQELVAAGERVPRRLQRQIDGYDEAAAAEQALADEAAYVEGLDGQGTIDYYEEYLREYGVEMAGIAVHLDGLSLGDGTLGFESALATFASAERGANHFTLHGTLGGQMTAGTHLMHIAELDVDMGELGQLDVDQLGIEGLAITIDKPIRADRSFTVDVDGFEIRSVRLGDTSRLGGSGGGSESNS